MKKKKIIGALLIGLLAVAGIGGALVVTSHEAHAGTGACKSTHCKCSKFVLKSYNHCYCGHQKFMHE